MAQHGVQSLALGDLDVGKLEETRNAIASQSPNVNILLMKLDVSREESVRETVEKTAAVFGRIDYAVNNAGITGPLSMTENVAFEDWQRLITVNLNGVWLCQRSEIQQMMGQELRHSK